MLQYILKRLLLMIPTFFVVSLVIFLVLNLAPGRPGQAGQQGIQQADESQGQSEAYRIFKEQFNLDKPVFINTRFSVDQGEVEELVTLIVDHRLRDLPDDRRPPVAQAIEAQERVEDLGNYIVPHLYRLARDHQDPDVRWFATARLAVNARRKLINEFSSAQQPPSVRAQNLAIDLENTQIAQWRYPRGADAATQRAVMDKWGAWMVEHQGRFEYSASDKAAILLTDTRFARYWANLIRLDLGVSNLDRRPVLDKIVEKLRYSVTLSFGSIILIYIIAVPLGIFSAVKRDSKADKLLTVILFMLYSLPTFFVGLLLLKLLSVGPAFHLWPRMPTPDEQTLLSGLPSEQAVQLGGLAAAALTLLYVAHSARKLFSDPAERTPARLLIRISLIALIFIGSSALAQIVLFGGVSIFPTGNFESVDARNMTVLEHLADIAVHLVLPMICLTYGGLAVISRYARRGLLDVIHADYIRTARAKGLSEPVVILKHAVRNGMIPILTLLGALLPTLVGGSVVIEIIYNIPGLGLFLFTSITLRDYNAVMGVLLISSALTLFGILLSDISYALVDPRISFK